MFRILLLDCRLSSEFRVSASGIPHLQAFNNIVLKHSVFFQRFIA